MDRHYDKTALSSPQVIVTPADVSCVKTDSPQGSDKFFAANAWEPGQAIAISSSMTSGSGPLGGMASPSLAAASR